VIILAIIIVFIFLGGLWLLQSTVLPEVVNQRFPR
jgi:hypothetical protein